MSKPVLQRYRSAGRKQAISPSVIENTLAVVERVARTDPRIVPVVTLRHLAALTDVPYRYLRQVVMRRAAIGYRHFHLRKRVPGRTRSRLISIPPESLKNVQVWIVKNILCYVDAHASSYAFHPGSSPVHAAEEHCCCSFMLKVDIEDFFHNISEGRVSKIFEEIGFQKLLSFELARLVTIPYESKPKLQNPLDRWTEILSYQYPYEGVLPQGAPTSPMLANLAMRAADEEFAILATRHGLRYTRYADDLVFSCPTGSKKNLGHMRDFRRQALDILNMHGFKPNLRKTVIRGPGSRRIVLGLLVDGASPRLSAEFKDNLRLHLYYLSSPRHGPAAHARARKTGISSTYSHVRGLIAWAQCVEPNYAEKMLDRFENISWPHL